MATHQRLKQYNASFLFCKPMTPSLTLSESVIYVRPFSVVPFSVVRRSSAESLRALVKE